MVHSLALSLVLLIAGAVPPADRPGPPSLKRPCARPVVCVLPPVIRPGR